MLLLLTMKRYRWLITLIIIIVGIYFYSHRHTLYQFSKEKPGVPVSIANVRKKDVVVTFNTIGQVQTIATVNVTAQVAGKLTTVNFKEGQLVHAGDILFTIDSQSYEAQLAQAEATLARDNAQLGSNQLLLERNQILLKKGFISKQDFAQVKANTESDAATVQADEAAIKQAKINLNYCTITAPITGRTGNLLVTVGNNITTSGNTTLVTINQLQPIYVSFALPENVLSIIRQEMQQRPIHVTIKNSQTFENGVITFVNNAIDNTTGTIQLKATFANDKENLWPGQFANVTVPAQTLPQALIVPADAIQYGQQGPFVFVIKSDDIATYQPVTIGPTVADGTVIKKGLAVGDEVVTAGQLRLNDGSKVMVVAKP
jgi:multidrug efflux system membrane fusion protein